MSALSDLTADIRSDFQNEAGESLVTEAYAQRAAERGIVGAGLDLDIAYQIDEEGAVSPSMPAVHGELWLLAAELIVCRWLRGQAAKLAKFASADKSVDRSKEAAAWASLESDLSSRYSTLLRRIRPDADNSLIYRPAAGAAPDTWERGSVPLEDDLTGTTTST